MSLVVFGLGRYLLVLLLCGAAYLIGRALFRSVKFDGLAEDLSISTTMGLGVLAHVVLLLGLLGRLNGLAVAGTIGLAVAASCFVLSRSGFPRRRNTTNRSPGSTLGVVLFCLAAIAIMAPALLVPLYPPTQSDVESYHVAAPKLWVQSGVITPTPFLRFQVGASSANILFAALMLAGDNVSPAILSLSATVLVALLLYAWGRRVHGASAGIFAAALWIGSPAAIEPGLSASYHVLAALFGAATVYALSNYLRERRLTWLFIAGLFGGFAQSTWSGAFYFVPILLVAAVYFAIKARGPRPMFAIVIGLACGWGPTLLRSAWYTGNPLYPLFPELLGYGPWWTPEEFHGITMEIRQWGGERTLTKFFSLPYSLAVTPQQFQSGNSFSIVLFLLLPFVALHAIRHQLVRWLAVIILYYVACWFLIGQIMRYLLPVAPLLCISGALTVWWLFDRGFWSRLSARLRSVVTGLATLALLIPSAREVRKIVNNRGAIPLTLKERHEYISARIPDYRAIMAANAAPGPIYSFFGTGAGYTDAVFMGDWWGPGRYNAMVEKARDPAALYSGLRQLGAVYLVLYRQSPPFVVLPYGEKFDALFTPVYGDSKAELYRLKERELPPSSEPTNLLNNPGFDELQDQFPVGWGKLGKPEIVEPAGGAASGTTAIRAANDHGLVQAVPTTPLEIYELQLQARAETPGASFRLQVNWVDAAERICDVFYVIEVAQSRWDRYIVRMTAPETAVRADVYVGGFGTYPVLLDSYAFRDLHLKSPRLRY